MRKLIVVALVSAAVGASLTLWAKSTVLATGAPVASPTSVDAGAPISPHDIMKGVGALPVQVVDTPM
jgi:hypothetical protein